MKLIKITRLTRLHYRIDFRRWTWRGPKTTTAEGCGGIWHDRRTGTLIPPLETQWLFDQQVRYEDERIAR